MLFNSLQFAFFFIIVWGLYCVLKHQWQNRLLLLASCLFYAAWDWRFLGLIFISITTDYLCALKIHEAQDERVKTRFLILSIIINLSILGFFKYFNFFLGNLEALLSHVGITIHGPAFKIILPLGISFYTFKTMTYTLDVYREELQPTKSYLDYALYVTFFPQLIAGPIARAKELLPQILASRKLTLDRFYEGCYLIFWGLFQKVFVADNLATIVNPVFNSHAPYNGAKVLLALYAYSFQIYCDFAGYSNMAIGLGKCLGFETPINFNLPYFTTNPIEFWRRWHMTLSSWLRDYVYTPIVMSIRYWGAIGIGLAVMATFLLCGLWHGAAWTFVAWGAYYGVLIIIYGLFQPFLKKITTPKNPIISNLWFVIRIIFFFHLICLGWLFFRAESMGQASSMLQSMVCNFNLAKEAGIKSAFFKMIFVSGILGIVQIFQFVKNDLMCVYKSPVAVQTLFYVVCFYLMVLYGVTGGQAFIYFQF